MNVVQTAVVADAVVGAFHRAVVAKSADVGAKVLAIGGHGAAVTKASQVFLDDEAQADRVAEFADGKAIAPSSDALSAMSFGLFLEK